MAVLVVTDIWDCVKHNLTRQEALSRKEADKGISYESYIYKDEYTGKFYRKGSRITQEPTIRNFGTLKTEGVTEEITDPSELYALGVLKKPEEIERENEAALCQKIRINFPIEKYPEVFPETWEFMNGLADAKAKGKLTPQQETEYTRLMLYSMDQEVLALAKTPGLLEQRLAERLAIQEVEEEKIIARATPAIGIRNPSSSTLKGVRAFIEQAIRAGNSYDEAVDQAYENYPHSLVNQATGRS